MLSIRAWEGRGASGTYTFCSHTSGESGLGTGLGFGLRVKMSLEASSSWRVEEPLAAREGAECSMLCSTPAVVRSEVLWGGVIAEGDIVRTLATGLQCN